MQGIDFVGEAKEHDLNAIRDTARPLLTAIPAFDLRLGPEAVDTEAALLHIDSDGPVRAVRDAIRVAIGEGLHAVPGTTDEYDHGRIPTALV
ncbi:hypothetical protein [Streptomyces sp. NPDC050528]|uniref:hypothetical protein n=1 Tax=Streptomyces sp. NPDC050528 TaxID=3365623 RepID=UPI00378DF1A3